MIFPLQPSDNNINYSDPQSIIKDILHTMKQIELERRYKEIAIAFAVTEECYRAYAHSSPERPGILQEIERRGALYRCLDYRALGVYDSKVMGINFYSSKTLNMWLNRFNDPRWFSFIFGKHSGNQMQDGIALVVKN